MAKKLMKGCEAIGEAAIQAGCRLFFGYPITPQNEVPEYMAARLPQVGGTFVQAESEVAASNMLYGAAGAGCRCFTSSSSPGISLMMEGISYIAGAELPVVVVNIMRGGPGLGGILPSQSDYFQAVKGGGHGDYRCLGHHRGEGPQAQHHQLPPPGPREAGGPQLETCRKIRGHGERGMPPRGVEPRRRRGCALRGVRHRGPHLQDRHRGAEAAGSEGGALPTDHALPLPGRGAGQGCREGEACPGLRIVLRAEGGGGAVSRGGQAPRGLLRSRGRHGHDSRGAGGRGSQARREAGCDRLTRIIREVALHVGTVPSSYPSPTPGRGNRESCPSPSTGEGAGEGGIRES